MHTEWKSFRDSEHHERTIHFSALNLGSRSKKALIGKYGYYDSVELRGEWARKYNTHAYTTRFRHEEFKFSGPEDLRIEALWRGRKMGIEFCDNWDEIFGDYEPTTHLVFPASPSNQYEIENHSDKNSFYFSHYSTFLARGMAYYIKMISPKSNVKIILPHAYSNNPIRRKNPGNKNAKSKDLLVRPLLLNDHLLNQISNADVIHIVDDTILSGETIGRMISDITRLLEKTTGSVPHQICVHSWFAESEGSMENIKAQKMHLTYSKSLRSPVTKIGEIPDYILNISNRLLPRYIEESVRYLPDNERFFYELRHLQIFESEPPWDYPELYEDELQPGEYEIIDYKSKMPLFDTVED
jgi:hypothetical protein